MDDDGDFLHGTHAPSSSHPDVVLAMIVFAVMLKERMESFVHIVM